MTMVDLWTNFATFHDPTPLDKDGKIKGNGLTEVEKPWKSVQEVIKENISGTSIYAQLANSKVTQELDDTLEKRLSFWKSI